MSPIIYILNQFIYIYIYKYYRAIHFSINKHPSQNRNDPLNSPFPSPHSGIIECPPPLKKGGGVVSWKSTCVFIHSPSMVILDIKVKKINLCNRGQHSQSYLFSEVSSVRVGIYIIRCTWYINSMHCNYYQFFFKYNAMYFLKSITHLFQLELAIMKFERLNVIMLKNWRS